MITMTATATKIKMPIFFFLKKSKFHRQIAQTWTNLITHRISKQTQWMHHDFYSPLPDGHHHDNARNIANIRWDQSRTKSQEHKLRQNMGSAAFSRKKPKQIRWDYPLKNTLFKNWANQNQTLLKEESDAEDSTNCSSNCIICRNSKFIENLHLTNEHDLNRYHILYYRKIYDYTNQSISRA